ncbi:phosphotransferase enzyme family protein [Aspergillus minisclerotigenes]|uniref:Phosphotransferase enzyme family protein n=1 Tax=Aspergillus minisclerotigenes TaxID=656917 RepID=A0A5N6JIF3_9EURO|nr:phosphotransferase enzyme family protein [Aspergillus minisclerotigenes]
MKYDGVAWKPSDNVFNDFKNMVISHEVLLAVTNFMASYRERVRPVNRVRIADLGAFNLCFRMVFEDGFSSLLRFPCPGRVMFPKKKVQNEVAMMTYLQQNTKIPVPKIIHHGTREDSPAGLGPFILMEYVEHASNLATQLRAPGYQRGDRPFLDPDIEEEKLEFFYSQIADILLEFSKPSFDTIGSLLVQLGNFPPKMLPNTPFATASSYYQSLSETEFLHLVTQRNDAVDSEPDCRSKYVARRLFCKLAAESRLHNHTMSTSGLFKLFCDDLRPTNILLDDSMKIIAVIDWEFTYTAPAEFASMPPWWLLLEMPKEWARGVSDWTRTYQPRLESFLRVLKRQEDTAIANKALAESRRISGRMRESWDHGELWVNYGARKSWAFDAVWPILDAKFFGGVMAPDQYNSPHSEERMELLDVGGREALGPFVQKKLEDSKQRKLDDWDEILA